MTRSVFTHIWIFGTITALLFAAGCDTISDSHTGFGTMEVRLHDAPGDFKEVNVYVERVEVNREDSGEGWEVIGEPEMHINLLELVNGAYEVIGDGELAAGTYHQIRLILGEDDNYLVLNGEDEEDFIEENLVVPSGAQTGLKLNINTTIEEGEEVIILLDFDVDRSIVKAGPSQSPVKYLLKPVVRAANFANTGNIAGTVVPAEARSVVHAIVDGDTVATTFADETSGGFKLIGLDPGTYTVSITPRDGQYESFETDGVEVVERETYDLEEVELSETGNSDD